MSSHTLKQFVTQKRFAGLETSYGGKWDVSLVLFTAEGEPVMGRLASCYDTHDIRATIAKNANEAVRWGEAPFALLPDGGMFWLAPVMINMRLLGCMAAFMPGERLASEDDPELFAAVRDAAEELRERLEAENLTNPALLELHRRQNQFERRRAEAIHDYKSFPYDFRLLYIREEPTLMNAIRRGDREEARGILNQILVVLFHQAGENLSLVKSFVLEIITMMCRAAVEAGCDASQVFGNKYEDFTELSNIRHDYEFSPWLHEIMERLIDAIHQNRNKSTMPQMQLALNFMREHLSEDVSRDQAAKAAHMSPSHFSRLFKKLFHESFSDVLNRLRIEHASELLARTDHSLSTIALDCGFKDQSYFTKVFRKFFTKTPSEYRHQMKKSRLPGER